MTPSPALGSAPDAAGVDAATKPGEPTAAPEVAPSTTPGDAGDASEPAKVADADAPKAASVEDVPDKDAQEPVAEKDAADDKVIDKPAAAANGHAATKDAEMTGALADASKLEPADDAPVAAVVPDAADEAPAPAGAGEREAAPQATSGAKKRKAGTLDPDASVLPASDADKGTSNGNGTAAPAEKRKPGRPPGSKNGTAGSNGHASNGHEDKESLGDKIAKKAKKVLPSVGRTERKTRSQGPL